MKKPIEPPLTQNERAALTDLIIRAARTLPTDGDRKRLMRLHTLDRADRKQERHVAGNVSFQLGAVRSELVAVEGKLVEAEATIARVRGLAGSAEPANPCKHHDHLCPYDVITVLDGLNGS